MTTFKVLEYELKPFGISSKNLMEKYLEYVNCDLSDYTFAANYIWLSNASGFYAVINDTFCLFLLSSSELTMLLPPIGKKENVQTAMDKCFEIMNSNNSQYYYSRIDYVSETLLEGFVEYVTEEDTIFTMMQDYVIEKKLVDYIYKSDDLIDLKGNSYHTKRNEINKFKKSYPNSRIEVLNPKAHHDEIIHLFNKWVSDRVRYMPKEEADSFLDGIFLERYAIKRMLKYYDEMNLIGIVIYIDDILYGFTVGEKVNENTASVIIEKTDFEILGCAQFIFREFSKVLKDKYGSEFINVGDDMGFENLRKVKMSYRPEKLIPKYTIYQK